MRKKFNILSVILLFSLASAIYLSSCKGGINYADYISENRTDVFLYADDEISFKIYCSVRETPYLSDGIKGKTEEITEAHLTVGGSPSEVRLEVGGYGGEMSYLSVSKSFYLSFSAKAFEGDSVDVNLTLDGKERSFSATSVKYDGLISPDTALKCVTEYDAELFEKLTEGQNFCGEIYLRLLFDDGCFYYVGVCDREGEINSYLVNGENGRIIATRRHSAG
ncbi:MAG: hypothetical protein ACI4L9_04025 [Candidatus Coproplasma sp.]